MRRSAACSCASPRAAASFSARSAVTAARIIEVSAATPTNSCVASRLSLSELRTNGPGAVRGVPDRERGGGQQCGGRAARAEAERRPRSAPGRSRRARRAARPRRSARAARRSAPRPSTVCRRVRRTRALAHVRAAGVTTSAPARSESHHMRQVRPAPIAGRSPAIQIARMPRPAPSAVPAALQTIRTITSRTLRPGRRAPRRISRAAATTIASDGSERLAEREAERRRVVGRQQIADHDGRPQPRAVEHEGRDADAHGRPERRHRPVRARAVVRVGEVQPDARGRVVRGGGHDDRQQVAPVAQPLRHARRTPSHARFPGHATPSRHPSERVRLAVPARARSYESI